MSGYKALYRKWRPKVFSDVIGQEHITSILRSEVEAGTVSHAYLFCGSRGTGKTTCAKILAKAVSCDNPQNGDPCGKCPSCIAAENTLDIYEIDAASHNGVENIRDLRDSVVYPPSEMKRRVYIIDEVHMLSDGAFNALLKTLEEPPSHVLFILATTELRKIPATILSRCKRFDFHRITPEKIFERLRMISDEEKINITDAALMLISRLAAGAMRDALSMLELFSMSDHEVSEEEASQRLGVVGREIVFSLAETVCAKDSEQALKVIAKAYDDSKDLSVLCSELSDVFRDILVVKYVKDPGKLIDASDSDVGRLRAIAEKLSGEELMYCTELCEDMQMRLSRAVFSRRVIIETGLIKMCEQHAFANTASLSMRISSLEEKLKLLSDSGNISYEKQQNTKKYNKEYEKATDFSNSEKAKEDYAKSGASAVPDLPPLPGDGDIPFDIPYADLGRDEEKKTPAKISPRPIVLSRNLQQNNKKDDMPGERRQFDGYAEFTEEVESLDKMAASMLEGGKAYIFNGQVCELEVTNPIAPMILSKPDKYAVISEAFSKILGYKPKVNIKFIKEQKNETKTDLSSLS